MTDAERVVCSRLKAFREGGRWPRNVFASKLDITEAKLVSVENGWTPLRYNLAWRVASRFGINLRWLATGREPQKPAVTIPSEIASKLDEKGLFSQVYAAALAVFFEGASQFLKTVEELRGQLDSLCAGRIPDTDSDAGRACWVVPPDWLPALKQKLKLLREYGGLVQRNADRLEMEIREIEHIHKTHPEDYPPQDVRLNISDPLNKEINLTNSFRSITNQPMPSWPELRDKVRGLSKARGVKTSLAGVCGVTRQAVAIWLDTGSTTEPGAEATLRLLEWVKAEEAKTKTSGAPKPAQSKRPKK